jgi:uncharacterized protein DUF2848
MSLEFQKKNDRWRGTAAVEHLVIAGWTGRDQAAIEIHVRELEELGVARPRETPMFYRVSASLLTTATEIEVIGTESTGEVEFVLLHHENEVWVGVGSDHTDRKAEATGVTLSKQMCPKPMGQELWALADIEPHWDALILRSYAESDGQRTLYQEGAVSALRHPRDLIDLYGRRDKKGFAGGTAMFCGTFGVIGGFRWAETFSIELEDPVLQRRMTHSYHLRALPIEG